VKKKKKKNKHLLRVEQSITISNIFIDGGVMWVCCSSEVVVVENNEGLTGPLLYLMYASLMVGLMLLSSGLLNT
jgi:hypothetical protein